MPASLASALVLPLLVNSFAGTVRAEKPRVRDLFGFELGWSEAQVSAELTKRYPNCRVYARNYSPQLSRDSKPVLFTMEANGCAVGNGVTERVSVTFVHAGLDPNQPAYEITAERSYPLPFKSGPLWHTPDDIEADLVRKYGKYNAVEREGPVPWRTQLPLDLTATVLGTYALRFLWADRGRLTGLTTCFADDCGPLFLIGAIHLFQWEERLNGHFGVNWLHLQLTDGVLSDRQLLWKGRQEGVIPRR